MDLITRPLSKSLDGASIGYYFYDLNAKVNYDFGRKNKLYLSGYFGKDLFSMKQKDEDYVNKAGLNWGNETATLRWNHLFNNQLFSNFSAIYSRYNFQINEKYQADDEKDYYAEYNSGIKDYTIKYDLDYIPASKHWIKAGATAIWHEFKPHAFVETDIADSVFKHDYESIRGIETGVYIEDTYQPFTNFKINGGLRYSHFFSDKNSIAFWNPAFRWHTG